MRLDPRLHGLESERGNAKNLKHLENPGGREVEL